MAIVRTDDEHYKAIASAIRYFASDKDRQYKPIEMAGGIETVAKDAFYKGKTEGKTEEYYRFWDQYQHIGTRWNYSSAFSGQGWNNSIFTPKYDINPQASASSLFYATNIRGDLVELLEESGVVLDTSKATSLNSAFNSTLITRVGVIDTTGVTAASGCYQIFIQSTALVTIDKLIVNPLRSYSTAVQGCKALENITIEGEIGTTISFEDCAKLTKASIKSIVTALSSTSSGTTLTLSETAVVNAFGALPNTEWTALIARKKNWTISLV